MMPILLMRLLIIFWAQEWDTKKILIEKPVLKFLQELIIFLIQNIALGNDINAAVGRYYNAAPGRNYYAGSFI